VIVSDIFDEVHVHGYDLMADVARDRQPESPSKHRFRGASTWSYYFSSLLVQGQFAITLASDPLGRGWDVFGTASRAIDYTFLSQNGLWYLQVSFVVIGHVAALVVAHDRALALYRDPKLAVRSQYWMLAVMVGFTSLALWLLAQAAA
jgi:hypothetical protein